MQIERRQSSVVFLALAIFLVIADQVSKHLIRLTLEVGQAVPEEGIFRLFHTENTGAAFGIFKDSTAFLAVMSAIGATLIIAAYLNRRRLPFIDNGWGAISCGLMLAGALGNFIDRAFLHSVTDFISVGSWPPFNIADSSVVCGTILFAFLLIKSPEFYTK